MGGWTFSHEFQQRTNKIMFNYFDISSMVANFSTGGRKSVSVGL